MTNTAIIVGNTHTIAQRWIHNARMDRWARIRARQARRSKQASNGIGPVRHHQARRSMDDDDGKELLDFIRQELVRF